MSLTYNKNTHAHAHALIKHQQELLQQSLEINTCTTAMSKSSRWCWKKITSNASTMAYHEGEGKAFTKSPAVLMRPRSRGQRRFIIISYKKLKSIKSSSKHTKRQPYWFSKCSGILSGWHGGVCGEPGSKTNGQRWQTIHNVPFQVYAVTFPFCSLQNIRESTSNYLCCRNKQQEEQMKRTKEGLMSECYAIRTCCYGLGSVFTINLLFANLLLF